jgi:hypothetical protein
MKKILIIGLLLIFCVLLSQAQEVNPKQNTELTYQVDLFGPMDKISQIYSKQNLKELSLEELNQYFNKAKKLRNTGGIMLITGTFAFWGGAKLVDNGLTSSRINNSKEAGDGFIAGTILFLGGFVTAVVSVPILATGSSRVKKVKCAIKNHNGANIYIAPSFIYSDRNNDFQSGIILRTRF